MAANTQTCGIELEFLAVYPPDLLSQPIFDHLFPQPQTDFDPDLTPQQRDVQAAISRSLLQHGVPFTGHESLDDDDDINCDSAEKYSKWTVKSEGGLALSPTEAAALGLPTRLPGVGSDAFPGYTLEPLEITSRILTLCSPAWQHGLRTVLDTIAWLRAQSVVCITNVTTGLHVHIGYGKATIPLYAAKRLLQLHLAFEEQLDSLYTVPRIIPPALGRKAEDGHFDAPLSSVLAPPHAVATVRTLPQLLARIDSCHTPEALGALFPLYWIVPNGHYSVLNFDNLFPAPVEEGEEFSSPPKRKVDFRQHQGTLDVEEVVAYIVLCATATDFCSSDGDVEVLTLLAQAGGGRGFGIIGAVGRGGISTQGIECYR